MLIDSLIDLMGADWWLQISISEELLFALISFVINLMVMTIIFYVAGIAVVGRRRALFGDALVISLFGTIVLIVCVSVFRLEIAIVLSLVAWFLLVRRYYETGWLGAIAVGMMSVVVAVVVTVILSVLLSMLLGGSVLLFRWLPFLLDL